MMKKIFTYIITTAICTSISMSSFSSLHVYAITDSIEPEKKIVNENVIEEVDELSDLKRIDLTDIQQMNNVGEVTVEKVDNNLVEISVIPDEPSEIVINEDGNETKLYEEVGLIIENTSDIPQDEFIKRISTTIAESESSENFTENPSLFSKVLSYFTPDPVYASELFKDEKTSTQGLVRAALRIVYYEEGDGFLRFVRSSAKINNFSGKSITRLVLISSQGATYAVPTPKKDISKAVSIGTGNGLEEAEKKIPNPETGTWHMRNAPKNELWCWKWQVVTFKTTAKITYINNKGESVTKTFVLGKNWSTGQESTLSE